MNENRRKILDMLAAGQITAEEAERLILALEKEPASNGSTEAERPKPKPRYLRVQVEDEGTKGPVHINVRVPLQLLRAGVKLASVVPAEALARFTVAINKEGRKIDLNHLTPENLEEVLDNIDDLKVDLDDGDKTKVRFFCE
jgi:hypothetical protein